MSKNAMTNFGPTDPNRLSTTSEDLHAAYDNPDDIDTAISSAIKALNQINYLVDSETERPNTQLSRQLRDTLKVLDHERKRRRQADVSDLRSYSDNEHAKLQEERRALTDRFVRKCNKDSTDWKSLVTFVEHACKEGLEKAEIQARCSSRIKKEESLRVKLTKLQDAGRCRSVEAMDQELLDIAGVRICLYFPSDTSRVKEVITSNANFRVLPQKSYKYVPFRREPPPHETGYLYKPFREHSHTPSDIESRPYNERMGFYDADHYWIEIQGEQLDQNPGWKNKRVEIQVRSVVMDAWAEVRHDLDYKNILSGYPGEDELRTLDSIKGSIATCEILLDTLRKQHDDRVKADHVEFSFPKVVSEQEGFQHTILWTLRSKHSRIIHLFRLEEAKGDNRVSALALGNLMRAMGITTLAKLREAIMDLRHQAKIDECLALTRLLIPYWHTVQTSFLNPDTLDIHLFDFLFVFLMENPVNSAKWDADVSYVLGLNLLRALELGLFKDFASYYDYLDDEVEEEAEMSHVLQEAMPTKTTGQQIGTFSMVWYLRACFEPGDPEYRTSDNMLVAMPLLGNLSIRSLSETPVGSGWHREWPQFNPFRYVMKLWQSRQSGPARVPFVLWGAATELVYPVPANKYDLLCGTEIVESLWRHVSWGTGRDRACDLLESPSGLVDTAAVWRVLNSPQITPNVLSVCLLWPEVDFHRNFMTSDTITQWQGLPVIAEAFRRAPIKVVLHALKTLVPSKINIQPDKGPSLLHYAALFGCTEVFELLVELGADTDYTTDAGAFDPFLNYDYFYNGRLTDDKQITAAELVSFR
jgi:ppGpp synthetase/RelA/SpoT-type nucleotidyltranferase